MLPPPVLVGSFESTGVCIRGAKFDCERGSIAKASSPFRRGAKLTHEVIKRPDGSIMHAEVLIGDSRIMIAEESEMAKATTSTLYIYVPDVDSVFQQAAKAGGQTIMEPSDKEDVDAQELQKLADAFVKQQKTRAA